MEEILAALLLALGGVGLIALVVGIYGMVGAYVLSTLWGWFAVPILGAHPLTVAQAWGLSLIATWFVTKSPKTGKPDWSTVFIDPFVTAGMILLIGWVLKHFI